MPQNFPSHRAPIFPETCYGIIPLTLDSGCWMVYIVKHKRGSYWGYPKGHCRLGEEPHEVATRELTEETGLELLSYLSLPLLKEQYQFEREGRLIDKKVAYFPAIVTGTPKIQEEELLEGRWVALDQASSFFSFEGLKTVTEHLIKNLVKDISC